MIQFILNDSLIQVDDFEADATLLNYLRLNVGLNGTKEGCASGDCGACTVVVASLDKTGNSLDHISLNSCICLLGTLHGKQVTTVEGLKNEKADLHPIQQEIVSKNGSQCGFCTPGFVMSIYAMSKGTDIEGNAAVYRENIVENIDGNLCRCTGYKPIIEAAEVALETVSQNDVIDPFEQEIVARLQALKKDKSESSSFEFSNFFHPQNIDELSELYLDYPEARLLAGGTDLVLDITQGLQGIPQVIYCGSVKELKEVTQTEDALIIGSAVTYENCTEQLRIYYPEITDFLSRLGSKQIRNVGTIGGNVANASPIGDMPPVLLALDAQLTLQRGDVTRRVSMDDFYTAYKQTILKDSEFLRDIQLPVPMKDQQLKIYKISKRHADDISAICMAICIQVSDDKVKSIRIALGGMAATVKRATNCEDSLINQKLSKESLNKAKEQILKDFQPMADVRGSSEYRQLMSQNLLERLFIELGVNTNE